MELKIHALNHHHHTQYGPCPQQRREETEDSMPCSAPINKISFIAAEIHGMGLSLAIAFANCSLLISVDLVGETHLSAAVVQPVTHAGCRPSSILSLQ
jgi:hypothetical protein